MFQELVFFQNQSLVLKDNVPWAYIMCPDSLPYSLFHFLKSLKEILDLFLFINLWNALADFIFFFIHAVIGSLNNYFLLLFFHIVG